MRRRHPRLALALVCAVLLCGAARAADIFTPDGGRYIGELRDGRMHGRGTLAYPDGRRYEGEFERGRYHGQGRYTDPLGSVFEGRFVEGALSGPGRLTGSDGARYEGGFRNWRFHGQGVLHLENGDVYRGGFADGLFEGDGVMTYAKPRPDGRTRDTGPWRFGQLADDPDERRARAEAEAALYAQRALLGRALDALEPHDPRRIDLYLLAVAGDGSQEVFRREVEFVQRQFERDYGARGRTIALINSRSTVSSAPMATLTSLREALARLAARMDREQDILFVFLASHGSNNHELVLGQRAIRLPHLGAAPLAALLRESGIRWKVVVVSACYGGGFIAPLADDTTMVIAAARHDRRSFGCADENEFTYFGRAFFKEALPASASFSDAFARAEALVQQWELKDIETSKNPKEIELSLPQMHAPAPIVEQLRRWRGQK